MARVLVALAALACAGAILAAAPEADLSGTWVGVTQVPDVGEDRITLELKAEGQSYAGVITDSAGIVVPEPITNVKVDGATLTFDITVNNGQAVFPVHLKLTADGDTLTGAWATDGGDTAPIALARKK